MKSGASPAEDVNFRQKRRKDRGKSELRNAPRNITVNLKAFFECFLFHSLVLWSTSFCSNRRTILALDI
jgi:hypothetical protein